jgi:hypothetical protein
VSAPATARPVIATPGARDTTVTGLDVAGIYTFRLRVIDRTLYAEQMVTVTVQ